MKNGTENMIETSVAKSLAEHIYETELLLQSDEDLAVLVDQYLIEMRNSDSTNEGNHWTKFFDMHSGGNAKLGPIETIYVELPEDLAVLFFVKYFRRSPSHVTCHCCGEDYSVTASEGGLLQATGFERNLPFWYPENTIKKGRYFEADEEIPSDWIKASSRFDNKTQTLGEYESRKDVLILRKRDINLWEIYKKRHPKINGL